MNPLYIKKITKVSKPTVQPVDNNPGTLKRVKLNTIAESPRSKALKTNQS